MVYSTITGSGNKMSQVSRIMNFLNSCSFKFQCLNVSDFSINDIEDNYIVDLVSPVCFSMLMNTFHDLSAYGIIINNNNNQNAEKAFFFGYSNYINNYFTKGCLCLKVNTQLKVIVSDSAFTCKQGSKDNFINKLEGHDDMVMIINCFFGTDLGDRNHQWATYEGGGITSSPTLNYLAHYVVPDYCQGVANVSAYGCNNDTCPADMGCSADAFKFPAGGLSYTEKFHDDINTPTPSPTVEFSVSIPFTFSSYFSVSSLFSESFEFSHSKSFSNSNQFTKTGDFTKTDVFSMTDDFTKTGFFSKSSFFTDSDDFTKTNGFSKSSLFSNSKDFTKTDAFSKTSYSLKLANFQIQLNFRNQILSSQLKISITLIILHLLLVLLNHHCFQVQMIFHCQLNFLGHLTSRKHQFFL